MDENIYFVQGYTHRQISWIVAFEYVIRIGKAFQAALVSTQVVIWMADYLIENKLSMEYAVLHMVFCKDI